MNALLIPSRIKLQLTHGYLVKKGARFGGECAPCGLPGENVMAKGEQRSNRETKKPKKEKIKTIAAAPSQKTAGWQPNINTGKKK